MATRRRNPERAEKRDFRQELTDKIVALVEEGAAPWQKPWNGDIGAAALQLPYNAASGRAYHGGNILSLMSRQMDMGSEDPRWCTYKQAEANGWQVRKGEKGTRVEERERPDGTTERVRVKLDRPRCFHAVVFNAKQIDGMPELERRAPKEQWEISQAAERVLASCGVPIFHDQADRAFYSPARDQIHLPPKESFPNQGAYYEVALHEVAHSSGHPSRMNRDLSGGFGSASYAREELRAQMCSLFLAAELGIPFNPERHAAYQASWVDALKNDKNEIFAAAKDAEKMADYVISLSRERDKEQEQTKTVSQNQEKEKDMPQQETILNATPEMQNRTLGAVTRDLLMGEPEAPGLRGKSLSQLDELRKMDILEYGYEAAIRQSENVSSKQAQAEFERRMEKLERLPRKELYIAKAFLPGDSFEAAAVSEALIWKDTRDAWSEMRHWARNDFYALANKRSDLSLTQPSMAPSHLSREGRRELAYIMGATAQHCLDNGVLSDGEREALGKVAENAQRGHRAVNQLLLGDPFASGTGDAWHSLADLDARIQSGDGTAQPEYDRRMNLLKVMPHHYLEHAQIAMQNEGREHEAGILRDTMKFQTNREIWNALRTKGGPELREKVLREAGLDDGQARRASTVTYERLFPKGQDAFDAWARKNPDVVADALDAQKNVEQEIAERERQTQPEEAIHKQHERAHEKRMGELDRIKRESQSQEKEKGKEPDAAQEQKKGRAVNSELMQLKNQHAGKDARLVMAKDGDGRAYTGEIIAETGDKVLQRVSDKYVVVHEKSKLARDVEVGSRKTLSYEKGQINVLEPSQERSRSREQEALRAGITRQYGADSRIHTAKTDIGKYRGAIVAEDETHVVQRVGKNSFVAHEKSLLSGLNCAKKDICVAIHYTSGKATVTPTQELDKAQRSRDRGGRDLTR